MASKEMLYEAYVQSVVKYCPLESLLMDACVVDFNEGYVLRDIVSRRMGLSKITYKLFRFFEADPCPNYGGNQTPPFSAMPPCFEDISTDEGWRKASIHMKKFEGKLPFSKLNEFKMYLNWIEQNVLSIMRKVMLAKIYQALRLSTAVRDLEESLPEIALEMIFLLLHTAFQFKTGKTDLTEIPRTEVPMEFLEESVESRFKEFVKLINDSYSQWLEFNMNPVLLKFQELPPLFFQLVYVFQALARRWQELILNEYCRTTAVILILTNFLNTERLTTQYSEATKQSVKKIIMILRESFQYMQLPSLLPDMDKKDLSEARKHFVSNMQKKFQDAHDDLYDPKLKMVTKATLYRGLKRCSFEENSEILFNCPFEQLINSYKYYPKTLEDYLVADRGRFDIKLPYKNIFFSDDDCLLNLPLMSEEAMKIFLMPPSRTCDFRIKIENNYQIFNGNSSLEPIQEMDRSTSNVSADNSTTDEEIEVENHGNSKELLNDASYTDNPTNLTSENSKISAAIPAENSRTSSEEERDKCNRIMEDCCLLHSNQDNYYSESDHDKILTKVDAVLCELLTKHGPGQERSSSKLNSSVDNSATEEMIETEVENHKNSSETSNDASFTDNHTNSLDRNLRNPAEIPGNNPNSLTRDIGKQISSALHAIQTDIENNCQVEKAPEGIDIVVDDSDVDSNLQVEITGDGTNSLTRYTSQQISMTMHAIQIDIENNCQVEKAQKGIDIVADDSDVDSNLHVAVPGDDTNSLTRDTGKQISSALHAIQTDIENNCQVEKAPKGIDIVADDSDVDSNLHVAVPGDDTNSLTRDTGKQISSALHAIQTDIENNCQVDKAPRDLHIVADDCDVDSNWQVEITGDGTNSLTRETSQQISMTMHAIQTDIENNCQVEKAPKAIDIKADDSDVDFNLHVEIPVDDTNSLTRDTGKQISMTMHAIQTDIENYCQVEKAPKGIDIVADDSNVDSNLDESENCSSDDDSFVWIPDVCDIDFS